MLGRGEIDILGRAGGCRGDVEEGGGSDVNDGIGDEDG